MEQKFIEDDLIILTKQTMDCFLNSDFTPKGDLIQLYIFYYYTSKWQRTNQVKCTTEYAANGLDVSEARIRAAKKELIALGLVEDVKTYDKHNRISGHYVLLKYKFKAANEPNEASIPPSRKSTVWENPQYGKIHSMGNRETNAYSDNNLNAYSDNNLNAYSSNKEKKENNIKENFEQEKKSRFKKPTIEEIQAYCNERGNGIDAEHFFAYYESRGWLLGKTPMKNWKAAVITWEKKKKNDNNGYRGSNYNDELARRDDPTRWCQPPENQIEYPF